MSAGDLNQDVGPKESFLDYMREDDFNEFIDSTTDKFTITTSLDMTDAERNYYELNYDDGVEGRGWTTFPTDNLEDPKMVDAGKLIEAQERLGCKTNSYDSDIEQLLILFPDTGDVPQGSDKVTVFYRFKPEGFLDGSKRTGNSITTQFDLTLEQANTLIEKQQQDPNYMIRLTEAQSSFRGVPPRVFDDPRYGANTAHDNFMQRDPGNSIEIVMGPDLV